jgi:hypothetical protein
MFNYSPYLKYFIKYIFYDLFYYERKLKYNL